MMNTLRQRLLSMSLLGVGVLALRPMTAAADTILSFDLTSGSVLAGNATTPPTAFCVTSSSCPSTPTFALDSNDPLSGTLSVDVTNDTMSFDVTLTQNATLGSLTLDAGSSFVATDIAVQVAKSGSTYTIAPPTIAASVAANLLLSSGFTETESSPNIPGIECSVKSSGGSCSLTIGTALGGANSLEIAQSGTSYNGVMSISANLTPVPLPASGLLLVSGLSPMLLGLRRRIAAGWRSRS
jgi:hypothetical protein